METNVVTKASQNIGLPLSKVNSRRAGIYCLLNPKNQHKYIGQSIVLGKRKRDHFTLLRNNRHNNPYLQNAYNKYGKNFQFLVLEFCYVNELDEKEQYWINLLKPEYNIVKDVFMAKAKAGLYLTCDHWERDPSSDCGKYQPKGYYQEHRPDWHYWVYGGGRNPMLDQKEET